MKLCMVSWREANVTDRDSRQAKGSNVTDGDSRQAEGDNVADGDGRPWNG